jgi:hypothetical protein
MGELEPRPGQTTPLGPRSTACWAQGRATMAMRDGEAHARGFTGRRGIAQQGAEMAAHRGRNPTLDDGWLTEGADERSRRWRR